MRTLQPMRMRGRRTREALRVFLCGLVLALALSAGPAVAEYDESEAGFPVRIVAYIVHPVGVLLDYVIMRPAWWIGSHEPFKTIFGRTD
jgi:hypothetical protein